MKCYKIIAEVSVINILKGYQIPVNLFILIGVFCPLLVTQFYKIELETSVIIFNVSFEHY